MSRISLPARLTLSFLATIVAAVPAAAARIIVVPFAPENLSIPHLAYNGHPTTLKAIARGTAASGCNYAWDIDLDGDYSDEVAEPARDCVGGTPEGYTCYDLGRTFLIPTQMASRRFDFGVRMQCPGQTDAFGTFPIVVRADVPPQIDPMDNATAQPQNATEEQLGVMRGVAVDDALWYLHLRMQNRQGTSAEIYGEVQDPFKVFTLGVASRLWEINGHMPAYPPGSYQGPAPPAFSQANDQRWNSSPYSEDAMRLFNWLLSTITLGPANAEDEADDGTAPIPGTNDLQSLVVVDPGFNWPAMLTGALLPNIALKELQGTLLQAGAPGVINMPIEFIVQQMVDYLAFAQNKTATDAMGGWPDGQPDGSTTQWAYIGLEAAEKAMGPYGVHIPDAVKARIASYFIHIRMPDGLYRLRVGECPTTGSLSATGGALVASGWLGFDAFSAADASIYALDWGGQPITRGILRGWSDQYEAALDAQWISFQTVCTGQADGLWYNPGLADPIPHLKTAGEGNSHALFSMAKGFRSLDPTPITTGGGNAHDWEHEFGVYYVRNQNADGSWRDAPWPVSPPLFIADDALNMIFAGMTISGGLEALGDPCDVDVDGDGFCAGPDDRWPLKDCLDSDPAVCPGCPQICDGKNNDCLHPAWPGVQGTGEVDDDGDGVAGCLGDCSAFDPSVWGIPGEVPGLIPFQMIGPTVITRWDPPDPPGAAAPVFDVLRIEVGSSGTFDFRYATCLETDGADLEASDSEVPLLGELFAYEVRAETPCGAGPLGFSSAGVPHVGPLCPSTGPAAVLGVNPNPAGCGQTVTFSALASSHSDPTRAIVRYDWDFGDGVVLPNGGLFVQHAYGLFDNYRVELRVTDDAGMESTAVRGLDVVLGNLLPVAEAGPALSGDEGAALTLDGSASSDANGGCDAILSYVWDLNNDGNDDVTSPSAAVTIPWAVLQTLNPPVQYPADPVTGLPFNLVRLRVTDRLGASHTDTTELRLYDNRPFACVDPVTPVACDAQVSFSAACSSHGRPDRAIVSYSWDFGDGVVVEGPESVVAHTYNALGPFTVRLTVRDNNVPPRTGGNYELPYQPTSRSPIADTGGLYELEAGAGIRLDGSLSRDPDAVCGDRIVRYVWDDSPPPPPSTFRVESTDPAIRVEWSQLSLHFISPDLYGFELLVTDTTGLTDQKPFPIRFFIKCAADGQCPQDHYCDLRIESCERVQLPGGPCIVRPECQYGNCDNGTCCASECPGGCALCTQAGSEGSCVPAPPQPEVCDGIDNDCDGVTDESPDCICQPGSSQDCGVGACRGGQACDGLETWMPCAGPAPGVELCNGIDDDCDSRTDEGFDLGGPCLAPGVCGGGMLECGQGGGYRCSTAAGASADASGPEVCNGVDDDCDGSIDEFAAGCACTPGTTQPCGASSGECAAGIQRCQADGTWGYCEGRAYPAVERCDGRDNDCDGVVDEFLPAMILGKCGTGGCLRSATCAGGVESCTPGDPEPERCDGIDNDCDGAVDEDFGVGQSCDGVGACGTGVLECAGPLQARCSSDAGSTRSQAIPEICDGIDNDCDGTTDEAASCRGIGDVCADDGDCLSAFCADGVCCNSRCSGPCEKCNLASTEGSCEPIGAGTDPDDECPGEYCDGARACDPVCNDDNECESSWHCEIPNCVPDDGPGEPCDNAADCVSGFCTDGVCCNSACGGTCERCDLTGTVGSCEPAVAGTDPDDECPTTYCDGAGACDSTCTSNAECEPTSYCDPGTFTCKADLAHGGNCGEHAWCLSGFCTDGVCCNSGCGGTCERCDLATAPGSCEPAVAGSDPDNECPGTHCEGDRTCDDVCLTDGECELSWHCDAGTSTCQPDKPDGGVCLGGGECQSGFCIDGYCCNSGCGGTCERCDLAGTAGSCEAIPAGSDPDNECIGTQCEGDRTCRDICASDLECDAPWHCNPGTSICEPDKPNGGVCLGGGECQSGFCIDGYCCNSGCGGACEACGLPGSEGNCQPDAPGTPDPQCLGHLCIGGGLCGTICTSETDCRLGFTCDLLTGKCKDPNLFAALITSTGTVDNPAGSSFIFVPGGQTTPAVAYDGATYLVAWPDSRYRPQGDIHWARGDATPASLDGTGIQAISPQPGGQREVRVAYGGGQYLMIWRDLRSGNADIYGSRVTTGGVVLDLDGFAISAGPAEESEPAVTFDGTNFMVVWSDTRSGNADIIGARVTTAGVVLDPSGMPIAVTPQEEKRPAIAFYGATYLVVWEDARVTGPEITGTRVLQNGTVLDPGGLQISWSPADAFRPQVASGGNGFFVAWEDYRTGPASVFGARLDGFTGGVIDPAGITISQGTGKRTRPAVAFGSGNFLVVWEDERAGNTNIFGARVEQATGTVLDGGPGNGIPISTDPARQFEPAVTWIGSHYLVVWSDERAIGP